MNATGVEGYFYPHNPIYRDPLEGVESVGNDQGSLLKKQFHYKTVRNPYNCSTTQYTVSVGSEWALRGGSDWHSLSATDQVVSRH